MYKGLLGVLQYSMPAICIGIQSINFKIIPQSSSAGRTSVYQVKDSETDKAKHLAMQLGYTIIICSSLLRTYLEEDCKGRDG